MKKRLCPQLQWARAARGEVRVLAVGARRALVENHRGVLEYDAQKVLLRSADGQVAVCGSGLALREVRADALIVAGKIARVEFCDDSPQA